MHLTLKLKNTAEDRTFIVGCNAVNVVANGQGYHVTTYSDGEEIDKEHEFYVGGEEYDIAYVENFNGATTHIIKPRKPT